MRSSEQSQELSLQPILHLLLTMYCVLGLFGSIWISDEFDDYRAVAIVFVGIPALTFFHLLHKYAKGWNERWSIAHKVLILAILIPFSWGQVLLLNAIGNGEEKKAHYSSIKQAVPVKVSKGPLGILYKKRW